MTPLSKTTEAAWARLLRVQKQAMEAVEQALKAAGFPPLAWYDVLLELGRAEKGLRQYEIAERMLLSKYNLSRLLDRLEAKALIRRKPCAEDGRGSVVSITANGRQLRERMWPVYAAAIDEAFGARLSHTEMTVLSNTLARLLD